MHYLIVTIAAMFLLSGVASASPSHNLLLNPALEATPLKAGFPDGWRTYADDGSTPVFNIQSPGRAGGRCASVRLDGPGRALLQSQPIPVAPGDRLSADVYARTKDLKPGSSVAFNVACLDPTGRYFFWGRFGKPEPLERWTRLTGEVVIPERTRWAVLQLGVSGPGKVLFDDASVVAAEPFALYLDPETEIRPIDSAVDVTVLNRARRRGNALIKMTLGRDTSYRTIRLTGEPEQLVRVSGKGEPGMRQFELALSAPDGKPLASLEPQERRVLPLIEMEPIVPTHFCTEDGQPKLSARVWVNAPADYTKGAALTVTVRAGEAEPSASAVRKSLRPGSIDVTLEPRPAPKGSYVVKASITRDAQMLAEAGQTWNVISRADARVTLNPDGYPVYKGNPIFPLGTFNSGRYALMAHTGFNVVHAWNRARTGHGPRPMHQPTKNFLDEADFAGMAAVLMAPSELALQGKWDEVVRRVRMFANHPGLLAWVEEEGVARGEMSPETLEKLVSIVRREDPNHPFVLADSYDKITRVDRSRFFREDLMDIGMWWFYPIPLGSGEDIALEGVERSKSTDIPPPSWLGSKTSKPLWVGLQAYRPPKRSDGRLPTRQEYRQMAYLTAVHGARGMLYYMGGSASKIEGEADPERPWGYLHMLVPELAAMSPFFMSASATDQPKLEPADAPISFLLKEPALGPPVLIAVNRSAARQEVTFTMPVACPRAQVRFEDRAVGLAARAFTDSFEPYGVHIYSFE